VERFRREELRRHMTALAAGDRHAFHPVFVSLWPLLKAFTSRHLPSADAEDAAQQALLNVFRRAAEYDAIRDALPWVLGVAAYEIRTARRKSQRRKEEPPTVADGEARAAPGPSPEEVALSGELDAALEGALSELSELDRETLRLFARGERPEVAGATFRKRVERALSRLRAVWRLRHGND
jgi:RNA polymerase sigma factor (sigma-70 family)